MGKFFRVCVDHLRSTQCHLLRYALRILPTHQYTEGPVKRVSGTVVWFNSDKGFGVIDCAGTSYYAHYSEVVEQMKTGRKRGSPSMNEANLTEDQIVTFEVSSEVHCSMKRALRIMVTP
jgi:cold shock CspA family protein